MAPASVMESNALSTLPDEILLRIFQFMDDTNDFLRLSLVSRRLGCVAQGEFYRHITISTPKTVHKSHSVTSSYEIGILLSTLSLNPRLAQSTQSFTSGGRVMDSEYETKLARLVATMAIDEGICKMETQQEYRIKYHKDPDHSMLREYNIDSIVRALTHGGGLCELLIDFVILRLPNLRELSITTGPLHDGILLRASDQCLLELKYRLPKLQKVKIAFDGYTRGLSDGLPGGLGALLRHVPTISDVCFGEDNLSSWTSSPVFEFAVGNDTISDPKNLLETTGVARPCYSNVKKLELRGGVLERKSFMELTKRFPAVTNFSYTIAISERFEDDEEEDDDAHGGRELSYYPTPISGVSDILECWDAPLQQLELAYLLNDRGPTWKREMIEQAKDAFFQYGRFDSINQLSVKIDNVTFFKDQQHLDFTSFPPLLKSSTNLENSLGPVAWKGEEQHVWMFHNPDVYDGDFLPGTAMIDHYESPYLLHSH